MIVTDKMRRVLTCRSVRDKIACPVDRKRCPPGTVEALETLVKAGYLTWLDRTVVTEVRMECDIYLLTPTGVALCDENGIPQK